MAVQADGKILVGGNIGDFTYNGVSTFLTGYFARLNSNGTPDSNFTPAPNYYVNAIALQSDGEILIGGEFTQVKGANASSSSARSGIARIQQTGVIDSDFNPNALGAIGAVAVQANGQVIVGGSFSSIGGVTVSNLARLNVDGSVDTTFNPSPTGLVTAVAIQSNGKIVIGGSFIFVGSTPRDYIASGSTSTALVDTTFNPSTNGQVNAIAIEANGQIILGGLFSFLNFTYPTALGIQNLARVNTDGSVDTTWEPNPSAAVYAIILQPSDNAAIVAGAFTDVTPASDQITSAVNYIARIDLNNGQLDTGFIPNPNGAVYCPRPSAQRAASCSAARSPRLSRTRRWSPSSTASRSWSRSRPSPPWWALIPARPSRPPSCPTARRKRPCPRRSSQRRGLARVNAADGSLDQNFDPGCQRRGPCPWRSIRTTAWWWRAARSRASAGPARVISPASIPPARSTPRLTPA